MKKGITLTVILGVAAVTVLLLALKSSTVPTSDANDNPTLRKVRENFMKISPEYGDIPLKEGSSSYTENKSVIYLCLRDPDTNNEYDINTIMYVAIHELAHTISKTHGHNDEFKANFAATLRKAAKLGIYDPSKSIPTKYCGVNHE